MTSQSFNRRAEALEDAITLLYSDGYELSANVHFNGKAVSIYLVDLDGENSAMHITNVDLEN